MWTTCQTCNGDGFTSPDKKTVYSCSMCQGLGSVPVTIYLSRALLLASIAIAVAVCLTWLACHAHYSGCLMGAEIDSHVAKVLADQAAGQ